MLIEISVSEVPWKSMSLNLVFWGIDGTLISLTETEMHGAKPSMSHCIVAIADKICYSKMCNHNFHLFPRFEEQSQDC